MSPFNFASYVCTIFFFLRWFILSLVNLTSFEFLGTCDGVVWAPHFETIYVLMAIVAPSASLRGAYRTMSYVVCHKELKQHHVYFHKKAEDICTFLNQSHQNTSRDKEWTIHINVLSGTRAKQSDSREGSHTPMHHTQCGLCEFFTSRQRKTSKWQQPSRVVWFLIREFHV